MTRRLINLRLPPDLIARVDAEADRLGQTRTKFIERALEKALTVCSCGATGFGDERARRHGAECLYAPENERAATQEPVAKVLGSNVRKTPSLKETWGR